MATAAIAAKVQNDVVRIELAAFAFVCFAGPAVVVDPPICPPEPVLPVPDPDDPPVAEPAGTTLFWACAARCL